MSIDTHLETLERKHGALEEELHKVLTQPSSSEALIIDIKRRKLRLKDQIEKIRHTSTH